MQSTTKGSTIPLTDEKSEFTRRSIIAGAVTLAASLAAGINSPAEAAALSKSDILILNFALQLEYLEAEFYLFATTGSGLDADATTGRGAKGNTTGGSLVTFGEAAYGTLAEEIARDETAHVLLLRSVLGNKAVAKPTINLNALGLGFANQNEFALLARVFEDVGVSAYGGAAGAIKNKKVLKAAALILPVEAYHAGIIRFIVVSEGLAGSATPVDKIDQPPTPANYVPTDENGLSLIRTPAQVAALVAPFFPDGLNSRVP